MSEHHQHRDRAAAPFSDAALRRALDASTRRLPPTNPPVAAVVRAGRRRARLRRAATGAAVTAVAAAVAALCFTVPLDAPTSRHDAAGVPVRPTPTSSASPSMSSAPAVVTLGSGSVDGIAWLAQVSLVGTDLCQHLTIDGITVDAAGGYWNNCSPRLPLNPGSDMGVHIVGDTGLRLLTTFGTDRMARVVVTFTDGTSASGDAVRTTGSVVGAAVPIPPGHRIDVIDVYGHDGTRLDHETAYA